MKYAETKYGFDYGSAKIERICDDPKKGWVMIQVYGMGPKKPKGDIQIYVTKGGKIRVFSRDGSEWEASK